MVNNKYVKCWEAGRSMVEDLDVSEPRQGLSAWIGQGAGRARRICVFTGKGWKTPAQWIRGRSSSSDDDKVLRRLWTEGGGHRFGGLALVRQHLEVSIWVVCGFAGILSQQVRATPTLFYKRVAWGLSVCIYSSEETSPGRTKVLLVRAHVGLNAIWFKRKIFTIQNECDHQEV